MRPGKRFVGPVLALAVTGGVVMATADADETAVAAPSPAADAFVTGRAALERLGRRLPDVAAVHGLDAPGLTNMLLLDDTLAVDRAGGLAYFDDLAPGEQATPAATADAAAAPPVDGAEFQLASLPGANLTIYLDFDGHTTTGTSWNSGYSIPTIVSPPYDLDGSPDTWSATELQRIRDAWAMVAEDFVPWQVNVTTIDPGTEALRYSGSGDTQWGVRVVITKDTWANCGCGGHAYIGAFDDSQDEPAFVYNASLRGVAEAITHEVGHTLTLAHDGRTSPAETYYYGHDGTGPGWAPIMGAGYYEEVTQWSLQEYVAANNADANANYGQGPDDVAVISNTGLRNPPRRADDHGDRDAPTVLTGPTASVSGFIGDRIDVDAFSFSTAGGTVNLAATVASLGPNLDVSMSLYDAAGRLIVTSNPVDLLDATIDTVLPAGTYVVELDGVGVGNPFVDPPSGYTDYGSLGAYRLTASFTTGEPPDTTAPAAPTGLTASVLDDDVTLQWDANGEPDLGAYVVQRDSGGGFVDLIATEGTSHVDVALPAGTYTYRVVAVDLTGNRSAPSTTASAEVVTPTELHATSETAVAGTVVGTFSDTAADDGVVQTITEVVSGGKPSKRHDLLEHRWQFPAGTGGHTLTIDATTTDGGDADEGVYVQVSDDGATWTTVALVNGQVSGTYDIGQRAGTIHVRVVDTDHSQGEQGFDSVSVDQLAIASDGIIVVAPDPTSVVATLVTSQSSAGRGEQFGVATVTVLDDLGDAVAGAQVTVQFSGTFGDRLTGTTAPDGTVTLTTTTSARKPTVSACIVSVTGTLPWVTGPGSC